MSPHRKIFTSENVLLENKIEAASIVVRNGKIEEVVQHVSSFDIAKERGISEVIDVGTKLIMPGVVDSHVHVNEPGRTHWEGYYTATRAAAAGGITTIIDMPLNCIPSTTSLSAFKTKLEHARGKFYVNVGFWGGIVSKNQSELIPMMNAGVMGFKCFLINSGVEEFSSVNREDLETAFEVLQGTDTVTLFHAEVDCDGGQSSISGTSSSVQGVHKELRVYCADLSKNYGFPSI